VVLDLFTRFVSLFPTQRNDAAAVADSLLSYFAQYCVVRTWSSDRGAHFHNAVVEQLSHRLGANHRFTPSYSAWSNGAVELVNKHLRKLLSALILQHSARDADWPLYLPVVQHCINHTPSSVLAGFTPAKVFLGRQSANPLVVVSASATLRDCDFSTRDVRQIIDALLAARDVVVDAVRDVVRRPLPRRSGTREVDFSVGDYVLVSHLVMAPTAPKDLTTVRWHGPAQVVAQKNDRVFTVLDLVTDVTREVHATYLKRYADRSLSVSPELIDIAARGGRGFVPRRVLGHRFVVDGSGVQLLVSWEPDGDQTWEDFQRFQRDASRKVAGYLRTLSEGVRVEVLTRASAATA
jgi:hypothetical protein